MSDIDTLSGLRARIEELEVEVSELNRECGGYQAKLEARTELRRHNERLEIECGRLEEDRDALLDGIGGLGGLDVLYNSYQMLVDKDRLDALKALANRLTR